MRKRSSASVFGAALIAASVATFGLVAVPGVSQAAGHVKKVPGFYLSLGDSYAVGDQPLPSPGATAGYTAVVAKKKKLLLENFGCGGATSVSILSAIGCLESGYGPVAATDAVPYPTTTQEQAAISFIAANPGKVNLITISIGGNDITSCVGAGSQAAITACVLANAASVETNVTTLGTDLRNALNAAGDSTAKIVGLTYPDVILGAWVNPGGSGGQSLASLSVTAFSAIVNPDLNKAYTSPGVGGIFVDVTAGTGAYGPLTKMVKLAPYGKIPKPVAKVCELTYYCTLANIHANTTGYTLIGKLISKVA